MTSANATLYDRYRGFIQGKTRIALAWILAIAVGLSARRYPATPGVALCFAGATLRFWASGYLRKDSRPAVGGPYAFVRNPLYLGTYLMAVGVLWAIGSYWLLAATTVLFAAIYHYIILDEETKLHRIFGEPYQQYCDVVPRFFPRLWPPFWPADHAALSTVNPEESHHRFSWDLAIKNKAYEAYATFADRVAVAAVLLTAGGGRRNREAIRAGFAGMIHHLDRRAQECLTIALDDHETRRGLGERRTERRFHRLVVGAGHDPLVNAHLPVRQQGHDNPFGLRLRTCRARLRQFDVDAQLRHHRAGDHKDDQQHEKDIGQRRDVDLRDDSAAGLALFG
jgi:protein-S-isoprenylcysteine O-methyltransferase Ste14